MPPVTHQRFRRRTARLDDPQARLLMAATELFTSRGYAGTSVREIVERAGVTKPVLYYHFGSKEGIYRALARQLFEEFETLLNQAHEQRGCARARIMSLVTDLFELVRSRTATVRFLYGVYYGPPKSAPPFDISAFLNRFRKTIRSTLQPGVREGEITAARVCDLATGIEAVLNFAIEALLTEPEQRFSGDDLRRLIDLLFAGAAPLPGRGRAHSDIHSQETHQ